MVTDARTLWQEPKVRQKKVQVDHKTIFATSGTHYISMDFANVGLL
jgi:hypothetical protein